MPTIDANSFYRYQEQRGQSGYKSAILVKRQEDDLYSLLVASQTVPSVFGSQNSFEFDLLNSPVTGKIAGKMSLDDKEVSDVLLHRDNVWRFEQLKGQTLDFLYMTPDFVGWHFMGTISFRPNDATADVLTGTYTIVPMSADDQPILNCRSMIQETLCFAEAIPENCTDEDDIPLSVVQSEAVSPTYKWFTISDNGEKGTETTLTVTSGKAKIPVTASGLVGITVSATGYASWTTTVYVEKTSV